VLTVPIVGWVLSSFVLHAVGLVAPAGLQGVYRLRPYSLRPVHLERDSILPPEEILRAVARDGKGEVYGLRLTGMAGRPVYVVRTSPFGLEWVYDAATGARLDPLSIEMLVAAADDELAGTRSGAYLETREFNRYYALDEVPVGSYLWLDLGPLEPRFRGQGSFHPAWAGGIAVTERPASARTILAALPDNVRDAPEPIQAIEWRAIGSRRFWVVYPRRDEEGILLDAGTGLRLDRLDVELAARAAEAVVAGSADPEYRGEADEYWMDLNLRIPAYVFRFDDPDHTDVYVSEVTGEVMQRRPAFWRGFEPFLTYHTFAFTGRPVLDTFILLLVQSIVLTMAVTGWRMARPLRRRQGRGKGMEGR